MKSLASQNIDLKEDTFKGEEDGYNDKDIQEAEFIIPPLPSSAPPALSETHNLNPSGTIILPKKVLYSIRDAQGMHSIYLCTCVYI